MERTTKIFFIGLISALFIGVGFVAGSVITTPLEAPTTQVNTGEQPTTIQSIQDPSGETHATSKELQTSIKSTVTLYIKEGGKLTTQGSGFLYEYKGNQYIITNHHVISSSFTTDDSPTVYIKFSDDTWTTATIVGSDKYTDIAVLDPKTIPSYTEPFTLASKLPEQGKQVYAIGAPLGYSGSVTSGIISATGRSMTTTNGFSIPDTIQTNAEISKGNSGGPLVLQNSPSVVVGVNRAKQGSSIGFAISSRLTKRVATSIIETGAYKHTYMGILGQPLTPVIDGADKISTTSGVIIVETMANSPAHGKFKPQTQPEGIEDIIIRVEGTQVSDMEDLSQYLTLHSSPGEEVTFTVYNDGKTRTVTLVLDKRPE